MPSNEEEDHNMYAPEDEEDEEDLEEEETDEEDDDEDEDLDHELHTVSPIPTVTITASVTAPSTIPTTTTTVAPPPISVAEPSSSSVATEEKKPLAFDDSRRLFQRLWTDEDEIGLLQGFLEFTTQRGFKNSAYHHDTAPFYDQIKSRLQLDFNKSQLVEKLRRLKKKYRNVMNRISSGKDFSFKSLHDQATFEISRKIWSGLGSGEAGIEDEEGNHNEISVNNGTTESDKKVLPPSSASRSRKRSRSSRVIEETVAAAEPVNLSNCGVNSAIPNVIEDTVRSCLSPLIKELLSSTSNGPRGLGSVVLSPLPLNFGGNNSISSAGGEVMDEKWRKQQILELEVYAKRMELVQEQIKLALEELRSTGNK